MKIVDWKEQFTEAIDCLITASQALNNMGELLFCPCEDHIKLREENNIPKFPDELNDLLWDSHLDLLVMYDKLGYGFIYPHMDQPEEITSNEEGDLPF